jgi:TonB family protein
MVDRVVRGVGDELFRGQQTGSSAPSQAVDAQSVRVKVYAVGPGVTTPELLPINLAPIPAEKCKKKVDGKVVLSLLVDTAGRPRNLTFLHPIGTDLDRFALQIVSMDRFNPGTHDGTPAVVGQSVEVSMQGCVELTTNDAGNKALLWRLRFPPAQKFGPLPQPLEEAVLTSGSSSWNDLNSNAHGIIYQVGDPVTAPIPLDTPEAHYTPEARKAKINGKCLITLIVDENGMPQNVRVVRKLDPGLDQNAIDAVNKYRFKPATKNGGPVPVEIFVEVAFKLY